MRRWLLIVGLLGLTALCWLVLLPATRPAPAPPDPAAPPQRVVSLAPNLTEVLFAIGAGDQVVATSSYSTHPPAALDLPRLGGHLDPDLEALVALAPDLVVTMGRLPALAEQALQLGLRLEALPCDTLPQTLDAITRLGALTGHEAAAHALRDRLRAGLDALAAASPPPDARPRVLLVIGRPPGRLDEVFVTGQGAFLDALLTAAGGRNVAPDGAWPSLSPEQLIALAPDVIIELHAGPQPVDRAAIAALWRARLPALPAARDGRVHALSGDHLLIPGPRMLETARQLAALLARATP